MAAVGSWDTPFLLTADAGSLVLNSPASADGGFLFVVEECFSGQQIRASVDNVPQSDGSLLHRRFTTGYQMRLTCEYWTESPGAVPACYTTTLSADLMNDTLMRVLRSMLDGNGRVTWQPSYGDTRLLDEVKLLEAPVLKVTPPVTTVSFVLDSPYPYAIDYTQLTQAFSGGVSETVDNIGTAPFYPVFKVYGPTNYFELHNVTTDKSFVWDSSQVGADPIGSGDYAEVNMFNNTIYLNGDQDNLKPGIVIADSDFWPLAVGSNEIEVLGDGSAEPPPDADMLWQAAWF